MSLRQNLEALKLPAHAVDWLMMLFGAIQFLDDVADSAHIERSSTDAAIWDLLVAMPSSPFWAQNGAFLAPLLAAQVLKWQASDQVEREGGADAMSFAWRAGYFDVVLAVVGICHGPVQAQALAPTVMRLYGETFPDYMQEFHRA